MLRTAPPPPWTPIDHSDFLALLNEPKITSLDIVVWIATKTMFSGFAEMIAPPSKAELARRLGCHRETVVRSLARLRNMGFEDPFERDHRITVPCVQDHGSVTTESRYNWLDFDVIHLQATA